jgi:hypothetical protein
MTMARSAELVVAVSAVAMLTVAGPGWAQTSIANCPFPDPAVCHRIAAVPHCEGPSWCDPVRGAVVLQSGQAALLPYPASPDSRFVMTHNFTARSVVGPLGVRYDARAYPLLSLVGGGEVPFGARVSYLESKSFGAAARDPQAALPHGARLDDPLLNGNPDAIVVATRVGAPGSSASAAGVWYDGYYWWVYNEDTSPMQPGEVVFYAEGTGLGGRVQHTGPNGFFGIGVYVDDPRSNGRPDAVVVAQHVFAGAMNVSPLGVWYDPATARWVVFNETGSPLALGAWIHYLVAP